jgi:hypothetical protein
VVWKREAVWILILTGWPSFTDSEVKRKLLGIFSDLFQEKYSGEPDEAVEAVLLKSGPTRRACALVQGASAPKQ